MTRFLARAPILGKASAKLTPPMLILRMIVARALAAEHGAPLGFHDEEDQLEWDRKAQSVLREIAAWEGTRAGRCIACGGRGIRTTWVNALGCEAGMRCPGCGGTG